MGGDRTPIAVHVVAGRTVSWCSCGLSDMQPFCDGNHMGSGLMARSYTPKRTGIVRFCVCKRTRTPPLCDDSHLASEAEKS